MEWVVLEWLVLALAVPVVIVVVVLLWGFVGCSSFTEDKTAPPPAPVPTPTPTNFTATANGTDKIDLAWLHTSPTAQFTVTRTAPTMQAIVTNSALTSASEPGLKDGRDFTYSLTAQDAGQTPSASVTATATTKPKPPINLVLTPQTANRIDLKWDHVSDSNKKITFRVAHRPKNIPGSAFKVIQTIDKTADSTTIIHEDAAVLKAGTEHEYQVAAVILDGFVNSLPNKEVSSDPLTGSTKTWAVPFEKALTDPQDLQGFCLIQRITSGQLKSGTKIRITVRGGSLTLDKVYISQVALTGNPWDSAADNKQVALGVVLAANTPKPLEVDYTIPDPPKDLLIAFDISNAAGQGNVLGVVLPGSEHYSRANTQQADRQDRSPGVGVPAAPPFAPGADRHYLIEKIEIL